MLTALVGRSLERGRGLIGGVAFLLCAFQVVLAMMASELDRTRTFSLVTTLIPATVQNLAGGMSFATFGGFAAFGFFHPVVVLVFCEAAVFLASEPAWEVESGLVDLTVARPVPRSLMLTRTLMVTCGALATVAALMAVAARVAIAAFAPDAGAGLPLRTTVVFAANLLALGCWFAALSLLTSAFARRRAVAVGIAGLAAVGLYLLHVYAEMSTRVAALRPLVPFHYFNAAMILSGTGTGWVRDVIVLVATAAVMAVGAYRVYAERDL